ncbi:MAG: molybdopterin-dependent oxidoreductase [Alphaproteobacteria bacterium]|jgi:hypothetical protein|nr:molybdopterin-dependent oxidoreductase [Alphaproteobacteria bacterium]
MFRSLWALAGPTPLAPAFRTAPTFRAVLPVLLAGLLAVAPAASAAATERPTGRVVLTVTGAIGVTNAEGDIRFDRAMLDALPQTSITTSTPWTEGTPTFTGVALADLLDAVGVETGDDTAVAGMVLHVTALNDYSADIPVADALAWPVVLASRIDGEPMAVRDKGPLWVIYPLADHPELRASATEAKMVWQVATIAVRPAP